MKFGVIAAGEGSRLVSEGVAVPKPLVPICGVPMIERLLRLMAAQRPEEIVVCVNPAMREVADWLGRFALPGVRLTVIERTTPSSMHTLKEIAAALGPDSRPVVTTVDTIFRPETFARYVEAWRRAGCDTSGSNLSGCDALMGVTDFVDDEKPLWVGVAPDMEITAFLDSAPLTAAQSPLTPATQYVSAGIYGLGPAAFGVLDDCIAGGLLRMRNFQRALLGAGLRVRAFPMGKVMDVDHAEDIRAAEKFLQERERG